MSDLPDETRIGAVTLGAVDPDALRSFYHGTLGLPPDVVRIERALRERPLPTTGLYHTAFLLPSRAALAALVKRLIELRHPIEGASDHLVSEAIYLSDPEGNGIEIYADRPRATWLDARGQLQMGTLPLDAEDLLAQAPAAAPAAQGTRVGHVHLMVSDVPKAKAFYQALGFDVMASLGAQASFVSAGGYHHHVGMNAWQSRGAPAPPADAAGLREFEILVPTQKDVEATAARLHDANVAHDHDERGHLLVKDPSGNRARVRPA